MTLSNSKLVSKKLGCILYLTGKMVNNEFHASEILMKCPSKYTQDKIDVTEAKAKSATI